MYPQVDDRCFEVEDLGAVGLLECLVHCASDCRELLNSAEGAEVVVYLATSCRPS